MNLNRCNIKTIPKILFCAALLGLGSSVYARTIDAPYEVGAWPGFRQAAIRYTFDDGCANQFAIALPMFDQLGFKMTLFTVTSGSPNWAILQAAADHGHEITSHTVTHPSLSGLTLATQTAELKNSREDIDAPIKGHKCLTPAYPYCVPGDPALTAQTSACGLAGRQRLTERPHRRCNNRDDRLRQVYDVRRRAGRRGRGVYEVSAHLRRCPRRPDGRQITWSTGGMTFNRFIDQWYWKDCV